MENISITILEFICLIFSINNILCCLFIMYPKFITKLIIYVQIFSLTILITIGWLAHFGTIGKYIIWKIEGKEYSIYLPSIINE